MVRVDRRAKVAVSEIHRLSEMYLLRMMELSFCDGFRIGGRLSMEIVCDI